MDTWRLHCPWQSRLVLLTVGAALLSLPQAAAAQKQRVTHSGVVAGPVLWLFPSGGSVGGGSHAAFFLATRDTLKPIALRVEAGYYLLPEGSRCASGGGDVAPACQTVPPDLWVLRAGFLGNGYNGRRLDLLFGVDAGTYMPLVSTNGRSPMLGLGGSIELTLSLAGMAVLTKSRIIVLVAQRGGALLEPLSLGLSF